jgi:hypothetical protein
MEHEAHSSEGQFAGYVDCLAMVLGREDRAQPLKFLHGLTAIAMQ